MAKILVIESNDGIIELLRDFFTSFSEHTVTTIKNAQTVISMIENGLFSFDLVIVANYGILDIKGGELTEQIKSLFPFLPIILMSGLPEPLWHVADVFLSKPFCINKLGETATRLLATAA